MSLDGEVDSEGCLCVTAQTRRGGKSEGLWMRRRPRAFGGDSLSGVPWGSPRERWEADLFLAELLGRPRRQRREWSDPAPEFDHDPAPPSDQEVWDELAQVCAFFGPNNVQRSEQEVRDAVVARANAEWTAWHNAAGAPIAESNPVVFGRLVNYNLAQNADIDPAHLTALQTAALGTINYSPLLGPSNTVAGVRDALIVSAGVPNTPDMKSRVATALSHARQANKDNGEFSSWSAVFVVSCVRGAAIALGLEAVLSNGNHVGKNELLLAAIRHSEYSREARIRRAANRGGTYYAFTPGERAPQLGDIIVQDRRMNITAAQVMTLAALPERLTTHGDIVVDVQPTFVVTIGGNLTAPNPPAIGESARKRRYPYCCSTPRR